jgi:hypothetical protein
MRYGDFRPSRGDLALKLNLLLFVLPSTALLSWVLARRIPDLSGTFDKLERLPKRWAWAGGLAMVALALVLLTRTVVLQEAPVTDDEYVYEFQARILASGRLYLESLPPPIRPFLDNQFVVNNGKWYGLYFFGHPALLAVAMRLGVLQWLGAIEAALTVLLACGIARRVFGPRPAILSGALLVTSPFFITLSATHLSQPSSTLTLTAFAYGVLRIEETPSVGRWWIVSATALACSFLIRPQTALFFSLPLLARLAWLHHVSRLRGARYGPVVAGLILALGVTSFVAINHALTGSAFRTGYQAYMDQGKPWMFPVGPYYSFRELARALTELNFWLLGWPVSVIFVPFFAHRAAAFPIAAIPVLAAVWYGATAVPTVAAVGPVYYGECIVPLILLSASGMEQAVLQTRDHLRDGTWARMLVAWPPVAVLGALLSFVPVQVTSLRLMADIVRAPYDLVERERLDNALVFVHSLPALHAAPGAWAYYHRNPLPDLSDRVLFVRDLGPEKNPELMRYLPHRIPYAMGMRDGTLVVIPLRP